MAANIFSAVFLSPYIIRKLGADGLWSLLFSLIGYYSWLTTPGDSVYYKETRACNNGCKLTQLTTLDETGPTTTALSRAYAYSTTQNNGRITQQTDAVAGEQVSYQYDLLNRLASAMTTGRSASLPSPPKVRS